MLETVFPDEIVNIQKVPELYLRAADISKSDNKQIENLYKGGTSSLSKSGSMIKYFASTQLFGREAAIIEFQLVDVDTNTMKGYEVSTYSKTVPPYLTYVSGTKYFEVPTVTYQGRTIHSWLAYDSLGHANWYGENTLTNKLSVIN